MMRIWALFSLLRPRLIPACAFAHGTGTSPLPGREALFPVVPATQTLARQLRPVAQGVLAGVLRFPRLNGSVEPILGCRFGLLLVFHKAFLDQA